MSDDAHPHETGTEAHPVNFVGGPFHGEVAVVNVCASCDGMPGALFDIEDGTAAVYQWEEDKQHYLWYGDIPVAAADRMRSGEAAFNEADVVRGPHT